MQGKLMLSRAGFPALACAAAATLAAGQAHAHHDDAAFAGSRTVSIEGVLSSVEWTNPHVVLSLTTADGEDYEVQWWGAQRLERAGLPESPFAVGDRIVIT